MANPKDYKPTQKTRVEVGIMPSSSATEPVELDYRVLVSGDFSRSKRGAHKDGRRLKDRRMRVISKKSDFKEVFKELNPHIKMRVPDRLTGEKDSFFEVELDFKEMKDFHPDQIMEKVAPLHKLQQARINLKRAKLLFGDDPNVKEAMAEILKNKDLKNKNQLEELLKKFETDEETSKKKEK